MSFVILGFMILLVLFSLGLGRAFGAQNAVEELETAIGGRLEDVRDAITEWWFRNGVPFLKRLIVFLAAVALIAAIVCVMLAFTGTVHWTLPLIVGSIALMSAVWAGIQYRKNRGEFSPTMAINVMIGSMSAMGAGIYLYGQMTCDVVTTLLGYLIIVIASEAVCAIVVMSAWVLARANQVLEGTSNTGLQFIREILFSGNAALQKIVDVNFANEEEFVLKAQDWCKRVRLHRDSACLLGILYPSPVTMLIVTVAGLVFSVVVRMFESAQSFEEADRRRKSAAKSYAAITALFLFLFIVRYLPALFSALPKEWTAHHKGSIEGLINTVGMILSYPTVWIAIIVLVIGVYFARKSEKTNRMAVAVSCLAGLFLLFMTGVVMVKNDKISKERELFAGLSQYVPHVGDFNPMPKEAKPVSPVATVPMPVQVSKPVTASSKNKESDDEVEDAPPPARSPGWDVICERNPNLEPCKMK